MDTTTAILEVNQDHLNAFVGKVMKDIGGSFAVLLSFMGDHLSDNLHLLGQIFHSASTVVCTPVSKAQEVGLALGAQAGGRRITAVLTEAGFTHLRRATQTDVNMVLEARP